MSAQRLFPSERQKPAPEWEVRLRATWSRHCEAEWWRSRRRLRVFNRQQQQVLSDMLVELVEAVLLPIAEYVRVAPSEDEEQLARALDILSRPDSEETRVAES